MGTHEGRRTSALVAEPVTTGGTATLHSNVAFHSSVDPVRARRSHDRQKRRVWRGARGMAPPSQLRTVQSSLESHREGRGVGGRQPDVDVFVERTRGRCHLEEVADKSEIPHMVVLGIAVVGRPHRIGPKS